MKLAYTSSILRDHSITLTMFLILLGHNLDIAGDDFFPELIELCLKPFRKHDFPAH
jgi:hypothetical protein